MEVATSSLPANAAGPVDKNASIGDAIGNFAGETGLASGGAAPSNSNQFSQNDEPKAASKEKKKPVKKAESDSKLARTSEPIAPGKEFTRIYVIFGYLTNASGELRSVLLGEMNDSRTQIRYVGKFSLSLEDRKFVERLQKRLDAYRTNGPAAPNPFRARWAHPAVYCEISHNGITPDGRVQEGQMTKFYEE